MLLAFANWVFAFFALQACNAVAAEFNGQALSSFCTSIILVKRERIILNSFKFAMGLNLFTSLCFYVAFATNKDSYDWINERTNKDTK